MPTVPGATAVPTATGGGAGTTQAAGFGQMFRIDIPDLNKLIGKPTKSEWKLIDRSGGGSARRGRLRSLGAVRKLWTGIDRLA